MNTTTLAERIRHARELKGLSREELSERLGVSEMTIRRWEKYNTSPRMEELQKLAQVLNVPVSEFMDSSPENKDNLPITIIPSQNKTSHSQETNTGMAVMTLQDGHKFEVPATPEGYAFLTNLFTMSLHQASPVTA